LTFSIEYFIFKKEGSVLPKSLYEEVKMPILIDKCLDCGGELSATDVKQAIIIKKCNQCGTEWKIDLLGNRCILRLTEGAI
jgi:hypothetical protein